jgi:hypothetical protein
MDQMDALPLALFRRFGVIIYYRRFTIFSDTSKA